MLSKPMRGARPNRQHWSAKGLVGEWLFNEGCGNKAFDSSGNGNHGTLTNMASPPTATSGWGAGRKGVGLRFDGSNDFVNCGNGSSLKIPGAITIEAFVYSQETVSPPPYEGAGTILGRNAQDFTIFIWQTSSVKKLRFYDTGSNYLTSNTDIEFDVWTHISCVYTGATRTIFINGVYDNSDIYTGNMFSNTNSVLIGQYRSDRYHFNGLIDGLKIYNRALSAEEIAWLYCNEYAKYQPRLTLTQLGYFIKLGVITDPSIESLSVSRTMKSKTIERTIEPITPERTFNLGV